MLFRSKEDRDRETERARERERQREFSRVPAAVLADQTGFPRQLPRDWAVSGRLNGYTHTHAHTHTRTHAHTH